MEDENKIILDVIKKTPIIEQLLNAIISKYYFGCVHRKFMVEVLNDGDFNNSLRLKIISKIFPEHEKIFSDIRLLLKIRNSTVHSGVIKIYTIDGNWEVLNTQTYKKGKKLESLNYERKITEFNEIYKKVFSELEKILEGKVMKIILVDAVHCFISKDGKIFKEMHDLLETYPNKKIVLTGANDEEYKKFGLAKIPYEIFSLKHTPDKTDPKYFMSLLSGFNLDGGEVIYFEHNPEAVKSAQSLGIKTYFYDNNKKDLTGLKKFLDDNL
jgi:HAD superfamily hydrolase (TIGR01509 family)